MGLTKGGLKFSSSRIVFQLKSFSTNKLFIWCDTRKHEDELLTDKQ